MADWKPSARSPVDELREGLRLTTRPEPAPPKGPFRIVIRGARRRDVIVQVPPEAGSRVRFAINIAITRVAENRPDLEWRQALREAIAEAASVTGVELEAVFADPTE